MEDHRKIDCDNKPDRAELGRKTEALCQRLGLDYYIKESLREEMEAQK